MRMIFVNLPVKDLRASTDFFTGLGFEFNPEFSDDTCGCMVVDRNIFVMLLTEARFGDFINGAISDTASGIEVLTCLTVQTKEEVDRTVARAIASGGRAWKPTFAEGPMYGGSFQDLDGHVWELMYMSEG